MSKSVLHINQEDIATEEPACLLCENLATKPYDSLDGWNLVKCQKCDFVFTSPRPTRAELPKLYDDNYFKFNEGFPEDHLDTAPLNRIIDIEQYVQERGRILEVGPAAGALLRKLRNRGWDVSGVEISQEMVDLAREKFDLDMFCGELKDFPRDGLYDVVCMYQALEHVPDPRTVLQDAASRLKPGGVLVVEVPNIASWDIKWNVDRRRLSYCLPRHLSHFHHRSLKRAFEGAGLEVLEVNNYHADFVFHWLHRRRRSAPPAAPSDPPPRDKTERANFPPLMRPSTGWKHKVLRTLGYIFPGWRVTVIGRKS